MVLFSVLSRFAQAVNITIKVAEGGYATLPCTAPESRPPAHMEIVTSLGRNLSSAVSEQRKCVTGAFFVGCQSGTFIICCLSGAYIVSCLAGAFIADWLILNDCFLVGFIAYQKFWCVLGCIWYSMYL